MARNKYPEITEEKILNVAQRLFLERGYDQTTIQDIVDELDGLTKGAVYHHFKSKEDIMSAVGDRMFFENNPFEAVRGRSDLNGLQKLREMVRLNHSDQARNSLNAQSIPLLHNPRILAEMIDSNRRIVTPRLRELIEEGTRDGSIQTEYADELSELIPLLTSLWLAPSVFPGNREALGNKLRFLAEMLDRMGLALVDAPMMELIDDYLDTLPWPEKP